jgi:hypothetical protein
MILITGADQFLGYSIAAHFAQFEHLRPKIRLLCQNTLRCHGFMKAGIDVRQVDYCHPHHISLSLRGVDHVVLAIGNEKDRVMYAKRICSIAYKSAVQSIVCISHVGAVSTIHQSLQEYTQIEEEVMNSNCNWTILRYKTFLDKIELIIY